MLLLATANAIGPMALWISLEEFRLSPYTKPPPHRTNAACNRSSLIFNHSQCGDVFVAELRGDSLMRDAAQANIQSIS